MDHSLLGIAKKQRDINLEEGDFFLLKMRKENFVDSSAQSQKLYKEPQSPGSSCNKPLFIGSGWMQQAGPESIHIPTQSLGFGWLSVATQNSREVLVTEL